MPFQDAPQCTAKAKSTGKRCSNPAVRGRTVCRLHGGKSLRGAEHPNYQGKGFSQYLPERLVKIYEDVEKDETHNLLERNVLLRETFIRERLAMIDDVPDSATVWANLRHEINELRKAIRNNDDGKVELALDKIRLLIDERMLYFEAVQEIRIDLAQQRADKVAIANIEHKGENAISATELMVLMGMVFNTIQTIVTDKQQRIQIADAIDNIFARQERTIAISE